MLKIDVIAIWIVSLLYILYISAIPINTIVMIFDLPLIPLLSDSSSLTFTSSVLANNISWWIEKAGIIGIFVTIIIYLHQQRATRLKTEDELRTKLAWYKKRILYELSDLELREY